MKIAGHNRNEALDCRNYAMAGFAILNPDTLAVERRQKEPLKKPVVKKAAVPKKRTDIGKYFDDW